MADMLSESASGVYIISATPFDSKGAVDLQSVDRLVEFYVGRNVSGITILGMMGEAPKLLVAEQSEFMAHFLSRVDGRVPVVVGVSNPGLGALADLSRRALDQGAAGLMIAPIAGLRTEDALTRYFASVFEALGPDAPVCYQDYPQSTGVSISVPTFLKMVDVHDQLVMLKHEDCPGLGKLTRLRAETASGGHRRVSVLCGNGGLYLPQELARGADGAMTGFAYPEMLVDVVSRWRAGDKDGAEDLFDAYLPLARHEQQPGFGLAVRKEVLHRRGVIASAATRPPGPSLSAEDHAELTRLIERQEKALARLR